MQERSLHDLRLMSVRPFASERGEGSFSMLLAKRGAQLLHCPVMTIDYVDTGVEFERVKTFIMQLSDYSDVIVVSQMAAQQLLHLIDQYGPQMPVKPRFFAVGSSSADILRNDAMDVITPATNMTSEGLLELPELQVMADHNVVICRGVGGRDMLADSLRGRGANVAYAEFYRRKFCQSYQAEINRGIDAGITIMVVHSAELLKGLLKVCFSSLRAKLYRIPLLVPSQRLASLAANQGFHEILVADNATPSEMVLALERWYINR